MEGHGMSAVVVATDFGGPEVLAVIDEPNPEPGPHEVRLAVRAVGVNPVDYKSYSGAYGTDPALLPKRLGSEASGVVDAVGPDVTGIGVGDEVIAFRAPGAYAEHLVATEQAITPKPPSLPWGQAAGLMLTGATATHALVAAAASAGETVLVHGGAGGVGLMAVQLARARRSVVIATASERNHGLLREFGAIPVAYGPGLAERVRAVAPQGVDAALDLVGTDEAVDVSLELVENRRRIVSIAAFGRGPGEGITLIGGGPGADPGTEIRDAARAQLAADAGSGALRVVVHRTFALVDAADAHRELMTGHVTGKIILTTPV
jgi:NADPH:quinone reductase-like Zn-dependent oxidoreductase